MNKDDAAKHNKIPRYASNSMISQWEKEEGNGYGACNYEYLSQNHLEPQFIESKSYSWCLKVLIRKIAFQTTTQ
jgi:hypothetical protein